MPFTEIKTGTPEELSEDLKAAGVDYEAALATGSFAVVLQGEGMVQTRLTCWMQTEAVMSMTDIL